MICPCGSEKDFASCCEKFISEKEFPATAEELMRSRYSAFSTKNIPYLKNSLDPQNRHEFDAEATRQWAEGAEFTGLEILRKEESGNKGTVEFKAHFNMLTEGAHEQHIHHEVGTFRKQQGRWYYKSGKVQEIPPKAP